ncbi:MAG: hypothetical protein GQ574_08530 [Crocinitomix sp.]|nr:hypothetical protein [Crocinitomix sp.]
MAKVQFRTDDPKLGLTQAIGFIWEERDGIHIEYQVSDNILNVLKSDLKNVFIPYAQIEDIVYKKSWLSKGKIIISLSSLKGLDKIMFLETTTLKISVKRDQKSKCLEFEANANLSMSSDRVAQLDLL